MIEDNFKNIELRRAHNMKELGMNEEQYERYLTYLNMDKDDIPPEVRSLISTSVRNLTDHEVRELAKFVRGEITS